MPKPVCHWCHKPVDQARAQKLILGGFIFYFHKACYELYLKSPA